MNRLLLSSPAVGVGSRTTSPVSVSRPAQSLIGVMLVVAAALDLTRCGLVTVAVRHPASAWAAC
jgi:Na+/H+ antiporter NhaB